MFCATRPASKPDGLRASMASATHSAAPRRLSGTYTVSATRAGSSITTKRQGWRFWELPVTRPASRICRTRASGRGRSAYARTSRLLTTAR